MVVVALACSQINVKSVEDLDVIHEELRAVVVEASEAIGAGRAIRQAVAGIERPFCCPGCAGGRP